MPYLDGYEYIPFPIEKLSPQAGELTWIKAFEDSPVEGAVLEFPIPYVALPGDEEYYSAIDPDNGTILTLEAPLPHLAEEKLAGVSFLAGNENMDAFAGSIYLGARHHGIDLHSVAFERTDEGIIATIDCLVLLTNEGLSPGENAEFDDTSWRFSAPIVVKRDIHNYRKGKSPSMIGRIVNLASRIIAPKG